MSEFRIRFITEKGFTSAAIRGFTDSMWSHAEIVLEDGTYLGAHSDGGVQIRPANYCQCTRERRYSIEVSDEVSNSIISFAKGQVGKGYDYEAIAGLALHQPWNIATKWFCSELVTAAAAMGGLYMLNVEREFVKLITPEMLHLSTLLLGRCYYSAINGVVQK